MLRIIKFSSLFLLMLFLVSCDLARSVLNLKVNEFQEKTTQDAIDRYNQAVKGGDPAEICLNAGLVATIYDQTKDQENYLKWKKIQDEKCKVK